jgi:outer membrane protein assembly factor BamB
MVGVFTGDATFPPGVSSSKGLRDVFITSYSASGSHRWTKTLGSAEDDTGRGIAVSGGQVCISGFYSAPFTIGAVTFEHAGGSDGFVICLDSATGNYEWHQRWGGPGVDGANMLAANDAGDLFVNAFVEGTVTVVGQEVTSVDEQDLVVTSLTSSGALRWLHRVGGTGRDRGIGITVGPRETVVLPGVYSGDFTFGGDELVNSGGWDILVMALDSGGAPLWARGYGGPQQDEGQAVVVDSLGRVYVTGRFQGAVTLGDTPLQSAGDSADTFIMRIDPEYAAP